MIAPPLDPQSPKPGLYPGLSRAIYESIVAVNGSTLVHFERSAAHAREAITHPPQPTDALDFGTAFHCAVLEPRRFSAEYVAAPKVDRRTNKGKATWEEFEAANEGKSFLDAEDFNDIVRMRDAVWSHPVASELLRGMGHNEVGVVFEDAETGLLCKGLIDRLTSYDGWSWIIDVKSTQDARPREFARNDIKKFHYGAKAAFYLDGCNAIAPRSRRFAWIAVEKVRPYGVAIFEPDGEALAAGRSKYSRWLRLYKEAKETGVWPGYEMGIQGLRRSDTEWLATLE